MLTTNTKISDYVAALRATSRFLVSVFEETWAEEIERLAGEIEHRERAFRDEPIGLALGERLLENVFAPQLEWRTSAPTQVEVLRRSDLLAYALGASMLARTSPMLARQLGVLGDPTAWKGSADAEELRDFLRRLAAVLECAESVKQAIDAETTVLESMPIGMQRSILLTLLYILRVRRTAGRVPVEHEQRSYPRVPSGEVVMVRSSASGQLRGFGVLRDISEDQGCCVYEIGRGAAPQADERYGPGEKVTVTFHANGAHGREVSGVVRSQCRWAFMNVGMKFS